MSTQMYSKPKLEITIKSYMKQTDEVYRHEWMDAWWLTGKKAYSVGTI